ncbi:MAG: hypothetical protein MAG451_00646 [Anaerolineales bacterium]|nr:hypothetical protein [Anaerolineales bacterium]
MKPAIRLVLTLLSVILVFSTFSALVTAGTAQLKNDNGDFYQGSLAGRIEGDVDGAVFTPNSDLFPATIQSVAFAFHRPEDGDGLADSVDVRVQIYAMDDGVPGDILAESTPQIFSSVDQWVSIPLDTPVTLSEPASFMAAVKWESGDAAEPAVSLATDSNLDASQASKDQLNLFHDANIVLGEPPCVRAFCPHSEFWGISERVGFNMIRVMIDSPHIPTATLIVSTPTATTTPTPTPRPTPVSDPAVYLPLVLRNFRTSLQAIQVGNSTGDAVGYSFTSGAGLRGECWRPRDGYNLWIGREPAGERGIMRSALRFDLGSIPAGVVVEQARLQLFVVEAEAVDAQPMDVSVHDVTRPWSDCPTWDTLADAAGRSWGRATIGSSVELATVDVTALVNAWLRGELPDYGLMLRGDEEHVGQMRGFVPPTSSQEDLRPSLEIRYRRP